MENNAVKNRTFNSINNAFFSFVYTLILMLFPFLMRSLLVRIIGDKYLGINNLFHSILDTVNLIELGFGTALSYELYKPIAKNDKTEINEILSLYKRIYFVIGLLTSIIGVLLLPFLNYLIKDGYPKEINIYAIYLIYLCENLTNYFLFPQKKALIFAIQRGDIYSKICGLVNLFFYTIRCIVLICFKNYYFFIIFLPISAIASRIILNVKCNKMFPEFKMVKIVSYKERGKLQLNILNLTIVKFGDVLSNSLNNVVISYYLGLRDVTIYNNYVYVYSALFTILVSIINASAASLGNTIAIENKVKNLNVFNKIIFVGDWIVTWSGVCLFVLYQDFMKLWMGNDLLYSNNIVVVLTIIYITSIYRGILELIKNATGIWRYDRYRPLVSGLINIVLCLILIKSQGIYGVALSLMLSRLFVDLPWEIYIIFKYYFDSSCFDILKEKIKNITILVLLILCLSFLFKNFEINVINFILKGIVSFIIANIIFIISSNRSNIKYFYSLFLSFFSNINKRLGKKNI